MTAPLWAYPLEVILIKGAGLLSLAAVALFPCMVIHAQKQSAPPPNSAGAAQYRPGDLPAGRWQHANMGIGYSGNLATQGIQFMQVEAGRRYSINGTTGTYKRTGDHLTFVGGSLSGATGTLQCRTGFLWMDVTFPDQKSHAWWGFSGGKVCP